MWNNKSFLAIIPARSGSKGLKDKNIMLLKNKPLIAYTIEAAQKANIFDDIIVSTDSSLYQNIAIKSGASAPFLRPNDLSGDTATSKEAILHTLKELKKQGKDYDYFMLLQPTSPLRTAENILESIEVLRKEQANAVVSVCKANHSQDLMMYLQENNCLDGLLKGIPSIRQKQKETYVLNGAIYLCNTSYYLKYENFYEARCYAYIMDKYHSVDIDDIYDFKYAEALFDNL